MPAKAYVKLAKQRVDLLRQRLRAFEYNCALDRATDVATIAKAFLNCDIIALEGLTDSRALSYLHSQYGVDIGGENASDQPLAGGLYVSSDGFYRWLFIDPTDQPQRRRFTISHELGHLLLEAEPLIERKELDLGELVAGEIRTAIVRFGRCSPESVELQSSDSEVPAQASRSLARKAGPQKALTKADLREIHANHFAAELLMPYDGVREILVELVGSTGVRTDSDLRRVVERLVSVYDVSRATAELRLTKDLGILPRARQSTFDLFDA